MNAIKQSSAHICCCIMRLINRSHLHSCGAPVVSTSVAYLTQSSNFCRPVGLRTQQRSNGVCYERRRRERSATSHRPV